MAWGCKFVQMVMIAKPIWPPSDHLGFALCDFFKNPRWPLAGKFYFIRGGDRHCIHVPVGHVPREGGMNISNSCSLDRAGSPADRTYAQIFVMSKNFYIKGHVSLCHSNVSVCVCVCVSTLTFSTSSLKPLFRLSSYSY